MYALQKKLLYLEDISDNLKAEKKREILLENLQELREMKSKLINSTTELSSSEGTQTISKVTESVVLVDRGMPYVNINKNEALLVQDLKCMIFEEFAKTRTSESQLNIHKLLENFQNKQVNDFTRDLEESKFFLNNFTSNLLLFLETLRDVFHSEDSHDNNSSLSSCSSITVDFENCRNNPNVAASSPVVSKK